MKINCIDNTTSSIMLFNAMCEKASKSDLKQVFKIEAGDPMVDVQLLVNGVEVDFVAMINHVWNQLCTNNDALALEKAKQIVTEAALDDLYEVMSTAKWKIENALERAVQRMEQ